MNQFQKRIPEQELILAIVEPMFKLAKIGVQVFHTNFVVGANDRAFKQAPNAFNPVRVNVAINPFLRTVVDRFMARVVVCNAVVSRVFIRVDGWTLIGCLVVNESMERFTICAFHSLQSYRPVTLQCTERNRLVFAVATPHAANLSANIGLVNTSTMPLRSSASPSAIAARMRWHRNQAVL